METLLRNDAVGKDVISTLQPDASGSALCLNSRTCRRNVGDSENAASRRIRLREASARFKAPLSCSGVSLRRDVAKPSSERNANNAGKVKRKMMQNDAICCTAGNRDAGSGEVDWGAGGLHGLLPFQLFACSTTGRRTDVGDLRVNIQGLDAREDCTAYLLELWWKKRRAGSIQSGPDKLTAV